MENLTSFLNGSQENGTLFLQFPFWRETLSVWIITIIVVHLSVITTDLTLLVTMLKTKKLRQSLNFIHMSVLTSQIAARLIFLIGFLAYALPGWQSCNCSIFGSSLIHSLYVFSSVYEPVAFAFLSCLQLMRVKGKKRLTKHAVISIYFAVAYSMVFAIELIVFQAKNNFNDLLLCSQVCTSNQQEQTNLLSSAFVPVFLSFLPLAWIPSLITVFITATWSFVVFKKNYTGGDDQLNKRILSIPVIMPIVIIATNLFAGFLIRALISQIFLRLPFGAFRRYWVGFIQIEFTFFLDAFSGFFYPILLLYLMPPLRQALRKSNSSVAPAEQPMHATDVKN